MKLSWMLMPSSVTLEKELRSPFTEVVLLPRGHARLRQEQRAHLAAQHRQILHLASR